MEKGRAYDTPPQQERQASLLRVEARRLRPVRQARVAAAWPHMARKAPRPRAPKWPVHGSVREPGRASNEGLEALCRWPRVRARWLLGRPPAAGRWLKARRAPAKHRQHPPTPIPLGHGRAWQAALRSERQVGPRLGPPTLSGGPAHQAGQRRPSKLALRRAGTEPWHRTQRARPSASTARCATRRHSKRVLPSGGGPCAGHWLYASAAQRGRGADPPPCLQ